MPRKPDAKIADRRILKRQILQQRKPSTGPDRQTAIEQANILTAGIQHQVRSARRRQAIGRVMPNATGQQKLQQRLIRHRVPQRLLFELIGVDLAGAGNMARQEQLRTAEADREQAPLTRWRGDDGLLRQERGQPCRRDHLLPANQILRNSKGAILSWTVNFI